MNGFCLKVLQVVVCVLHAYSRPHVAKLPTSSRDIATGRLCQQEVNISEYAANAGLPKLNMVAVGNPKTVKKRAKQKRRRQRRRDERDQEEGQEVDLARSQAP